MCIGLHPKQQDSFTSFFVQEKKQKTYDETVGEKCEGLVYGKLGGWQRKRNNFCSSVAERACHARFQAFCVPFMGKGSTLLLEIHHDQEINSWTCIYYCFKVSLITFPPLLGCFVGIAREQYWSNTSETQTFCKSIGNCKTIVNPQRTGLLWKCF